MTGDEFLAGDVLRHGEYLCLAPAEAADVAAIARAPIPALARRLGLAHEFDAPAPSDGAVAFLRRHAVSPRDLADPGLERAEWVVHVAAPGPEPVAAFCAEALAALGGHVTVRRLGGVVQPRNYSGAAMTRWAYARAVVQQPGPRMPNAFLIPMSKTAAWWRKDWMERHTYFLPRYDDEGRMLAEGHALAAEAGIPCILRRTYRAPEVPAPSGAYDFVTYFECADAHVPVFAQVCANLRDVARNPEWRYVREGPTWHGRRVASWEALFGRGGAA